MIPGGPLVVLREDRGGPAAVRVERIRRYLGVRSARRQRVWEREHRRQEREAAKPVPCVYCGEPTSVWERSAGIGICGQHHQRMSGRYPFRVDARRADLPRPLEEALFAARKALYVFEKLVQQEELHVRQAR